MKPPKELEWILDHSLPKDVVYCFDTGRLRVVVEKK
jgi:hypothetical protein